MCWHSGDTERPLRGLLVGHDLQPLHGSLRQVDGNTLPQEERFLLLAFCHWTRLASSGPRATSNWILAVPFSALMSTGFDFSVETITADGQRTQTEAHGTFDGRDYVAKGAALKLVDGKPEMVQVVS